MTCPHLTSQRAALDTRERRDTQLALRLVLGTLLAVALMRATAVLAAGVVGTGTPDSCTEAALDGALAGGGSVTFNCGASPVTIPVTTTKVIAQDSTIDGDGLLTIDGNHSVALFKVNGGITLTVENLAIANGSAASVSSIPPINVGGAIYNGNGTLTVTNSTFSEK